MTSSTVRAMLARALQLWEQGSGPLKLQVWMTLVMIGVAAGVVYAQTNQATTAGEWVTPQNVISLLFLIYGVGMNVQQLRDQLRRIADLETFRDKIAPETYMRKDVFEATYAPRNHRHDRDDG